MDDDNKLVSAVAFTLFLAALGLIAMIYLTRPVLAAECLTKQEARAKWPTTHIWWRTPDHCWTNNPKQRDFRKRESKPKEDDKPRPAPPARADANVYVTENEFNALDAQADNKPQEFYPTLMPMSEQPAALMLNPTASTKWRSITDPDVMVMFRPWEFRAAGAFAR